MSNPGHILDQIWTEIRKSEVVIADVTGGKCNVYYEVGLAHALGKDIIFVTQHTVRLPFESWTSRLLRYILITLTTSKLKLERPSQQ